MRVINVERRKMSTNFFERFSTARGHNYNPQFDGGGKNNNNIQGLSKVCVYWQFLHFFGRRSVCNDSNKS